MTNTNPGESLEAGEAMLEGTGLTAADALLTRANPTVGHIPTKADEDQDLVIITAEEVGEQQRLLDGKRRLRQAGERPLHVPGGQRPQSHGGGGYKFLLVYIYYTPCDHNVQCTFSYGKKILHTK